jgi:heat shock protein HtpX
MTAAALAMPFPSTHQEAPDHSVLAGTLTFDARRLHRSRVGTAVILGISAVAGALVFCLVMAFVSAAFANALGAAFWLAVMPVAVICAVLWGTLVGSLSMAAASRQVVREMDVELVDDDDPLQEQVRDICERLQVGNVPRLGVYPSQDINGFAVGDAAGQPVIGLSRGAVERLTEGQLAALIGHEIGHIAANDTARMVYAKCFQKSLVWWMLFSPLKALGRWLFSTIGEILVLGLSRSREFRADAFGAAVAGKVEMISLLRVLKGDRAPAPSAAGVAPELFFSDVARRAFATHPPISARIRALEGDRHMSELRLRQMLPNA